MVIKNEADLQLLKGISIIEVSGESCANCYSMMPILARLVKNREDVVLHHLEVSKETMPLIQKWEIYSVPTILVCQGSTVVDRVRGYQPEEILEIWLDAKIESLKA